MKDRLFALLQYPLPHHLLSRMVRGLTRLPLGPVTPVLIRAFARHFGVNLSEAAEPSLAAYRSFNAFFTRALQPGVRTIVSGERDIACPVDGTVSQAGRIDNNRLFQAKGHDYSLEALLGGDTDMAAAFTNGRFATIYLSPRDYHRIHMPETGRLRRMIHAPGRLFSVNAATTREVPGLFARNERVIALFDTAHGPMAVILVGALFVGCMEMIWADDIEAVDWHGAVQPVLIPGARYIDYTQDEGSAITPQRGDEIGRFNMGSTVIVLFGPDAMELADTIRPDQPVQLGQPLGIWKSGS